jgi:hypothetical protein
VHCIFVDKLLNIYIIYFVAVSVFAAPSTDYCLQTKCNRRMCVCVKGLRYGSPLGLRKRDPLIILVEIPTGPNPKFVQCVKYGTRVPYCLT